MALTKCSKCKKRNLKKCINCVTKFVKQISIKKRIIILVIIFLIPLTTLMAAVIVPRINHNEENEISEQVVIKLLGETNITINMYEEYTSEGAIVIINGEETEHEVKVIGEVDTQLPGEYIIRYQFQEYEAIRTVTVIDNVPPIIKLKGRSEITIAEGDEYKELGAEAHDNVDGDISYRIVITGEVGKRIGTYKITYTVSDTAGNESYVTRDVKVIRRNVIRQAPVEVRPPEPPRTGCNNNNEVTRFQFINNGIRVFGTNRANIRSISLIDSAGNARATVNTVRSGNTYRADLRLNNLSNGNYFLYLNTGTTTTTTHCEPNEENNLVCEERETVSGTRQRAITCLTTWGRPGRARKGNSLATFSYPNNNIQVNISNFRFSYDILIDVGHGERDPGAVNSTHFESHLNLTVSLYEAKRFEEHGLRVGLNRTNNNVQMLRGPSYLTDFQRRIYGLGHYGAVSRVVFSNHHNSSGDTRRNGPEIIVPASFSATQLAPERRILNDWMNFTPNLLAGQMRFYTRDFDSERFLSKINGQVHNVRDWYAVNRIPLELFNVKAVIFEPAYMSNRANFQWYWHEENWIQMSEMKIRTYVEHLGITYVPPTTN